MLSEDPPVISFEDFISDDEIAALLRHAEGRFVRSTASGQSGLRVRARVRIRGVRGLYGQASP